LLAFRSRTGALASAIALMLILPECAQAYRPFSGTDASVAEPRQLETEVGPLGYERVGEERLLVIPELEVTYGAGSGFEFGIEGRPPHGGVIWARAEAAARIRKSAETTGTIQGSNRFRIRTPPRQRDTDRRPRRPPSPPPRLIS
jgi:hypothetical protein